MLGEGRAVGVGVGVGVAHWYVFVKSWSTFNYKLYLAAKFTVMEHNLSLSLLSLSLKMNPHTTTTGAVEMMLQV